MLRVLSRAERLVLGESLLAVKSCRWQTRLRTRHVIIGWWSIECGRLRSVLGHRSLACLINLRQRLRHIWCLGVRLDYGGCSTIICIDFLGGSKNGGTKRGAWLA